MAAILLGALVAACLVWLALEMRAAPRGWEDESGFHRGRRP